MEIVKPFVKWAGGKNSLIPQLTKYYPFELKNGTIERYIEPFVGGGAVLIDILQKYEVKEAYAFDINKDLINCYNVIKTNVENLIQELDKKEKEFLILDNDARQQYFYDIRAEYNSYTLNEDIDEVGKKSTLKQGYLEASNVNVATEMVNLITAQRAYELCSKAITTSDTMMEQANNLKR